MRRSPSIRVIDFFCGAGGFSEGFRQQGFQIVMGIDNWQPAIDTHNLNHGLNDKVNDVLDFWSDDSSNVQKINLLPDTEVIIGSPSCVSFSMSNRAGKADKTLGIELIEAYLRVVAVKKHQKNSKLVAWFMENVPQSKPHIKERYTFNDLNLAKWALKNKKKPSETALVMQGDILNAGDYGAPQDRKRYIVSEWTATGKFIRPSITHKEHVRSREIRGKMPKPIMVANDKSWKDPNYPSLVLKTSEITDHFYDTGLYEIEWEKAEHLKINHPFMGRMSFPENEDRTCRTIIATRSGTTREAIIYRSEYDRKGNGEYRLPTIREIASLMGFPYVYQFAGSTETIKWRQVGNSVCPQMSAALARALRVQMGLKPIDSNSIHFSTPNKAGTDILNLNTFREKQFDKPRRRKINARFRRHPLKVGNMTVDLLNYHPNKDVKITGRWYVAAFFGTGNQHGVKILKSSDLATVCGLLNGDKQLDVFKESMGKKMPKAHELQQIYERDLLLKDERNPLKVIKRLGKKIEAKIPNDKFVETRDWLPRDKVPVAQLYAMYGLLSMFGTD